MPEENLGGAPLRTIRVYKERRADRSEKRWEERRAYCWAVENCELSLRAQCHAYIVQENCWDFWVIKGAKHKGCCRKLDDCRECPVTRRKFAERLPVFVRTGEEAASAAAITAPAASVVCKHLHVLGANMPEGRSLRQLLREEAQDDHDTFRCRLRGVHLDPSYVGDICATRSSRDCVFL